MHANPLLRLAAACGLLLFALAGQGREIVDMAGRKVTVPDRIARVYGSAPPLNVLLYAVAPDTMISVSFPFSEDDKRYVSPQAAALPVLGGVIGMGQQMEPETVKAARPDIALAWKSPFTDQKKIEETFARIGLPVVFVSMDTLAEWPAAINFVGKLLGREARAKPLADYVSQSMAKVGKAVAALPEAKRVRVYYAESPDGLATDCHRSFHTEPIELAGGYNVYRCEPTSHIGMERISPEQILAFNPQVIIVQDTAAIAVIRSDPRWKGVQAVKDGRIYAVPRTPFNWIDRPPSFMRALGIQWLANLFYPDLYPLQVQRETMAFYKQFLGVDLTHADIERIFGGAGNLDHAGHAH